MTSIYSDEQATELPIAYVTLHSRHDATAKAPSERRALLDQIRAWVDAQVAGYKKIRGGVWELQSLPKTPSGKILRKDLPCRVAEARAAKL